MHLLYVQDALSLSTSSPAAPAHVADAPLLSDVLDELQKRLAPGATLQSVFDVQSLDDLQACLRLPHGASMLIDYGKGLGSGKFGSVFEADLMTCDGACRRVAAKVLPLATQGCEQADLTPAERQASVVSEVLMHTLVREHGGCGVVGFHGATVLPPCPSECPDQCCASTPQGWRVVLLLERCSHGSLANFISSMRQRLEASPDPRAVWVTAMSVYRSLVQCVVELHALGLRHNDLKPHNALLTGEADGTGVTLCDMGMTCHEGAEAYGCYGFGTEAYNAPEVRVAMEE